MSREKSEALLLEMFITDRVIPWALCEITRLILRASVRALPLLFN